MKNIKFFSLAALLMAGAAFTACSSDNDTTDEQQNVNKEGKYTLTIKAAKGDNTATRALAENNFTGDIDATWSASDEVKVYKSRAWVGTLKPDTYGGAVTTLSGYLEGVEPSDELTLKFQTPDNYVTQEGTLAWIAQNCDYATATVVVDHISGSTLVPKFSETTFVNQQAIVKFVLEDCEDIHSMNISVGYCGDYEGPKAERVELPYGEASKEIFVALPNANLITSIFITDAVDEGNNHYTRAMKEFDKGYLKNGDFKTITVKMSPKN